MKKNRGIVLLLLLAIALPWALVGCGENEVTPVADFTLSIEGESFGPETFADLEAQTLTLTRFGRDGKESVECSGYLLRDVLAAADFSFDDKVTLSAQDGFAATLTAEQAMLDTTLLVMREDGDDLDDADRPMLAVDDAGGNFWVRGVRFIDEGEVEP